MRRALASVGYMFALTLLCTSMVSAIKYVNEGRIERNEAVKFQRIVLQVLGMVAGHRLPDEEVLRLFQDRVTPVEAGGRTVYVGRGQAGNILGYAFPVGGSGFWGPIYGMVGVGWEGGRIIGIAFYRHSETPGLGGRISEDWFAGQFAGLPLHPITGDRKIFYLVPAGTGKSPDQLDAITGATGTSRAVETFLNRDLDGFLKDIWKDLRKDVDATGRRRGQNRRLEG